MFGNLPKFNDQSYDHFITTKTYKNRPYFKEDKCCLILLEDLDFYRKCLGFRVFGYTILPDHIHCLIYWDVEESKNLTVSKIMQMFKSHSAKEISYYLQKGRRKPSLSPYTKGASEGSHLPSSYKWEDRGKVHTKSKVKIWQKGFYDFNIYSEKKLIEKLNYIHKNAVTAGLCENPENYKWSSYNQIVGIDKRPIFDVDFL